MKRLRTTVLLGTVTSLMLILSACSGAAGAADSSHSEVYPTNSSVEAEASRAESEPARDKEIGGSQGSDEVSDEDRRNAARERVLANQERAREHDASQTLARQEQAADVLGEWSRNGVLYLVFSSGGAGEFLGDSESNRSTSIRWSTGGNNPTVTIGRGQYVWNVNGDILTLTSRSGEAHTFVRGIYRNSRGFTGQAIAREVARIGSGGTWSCEAGVIGDLVRCDRVGPLRDWYRWEIVGNDGDRPELLLTPSHWLN